MITKIYQLFGSKTRVRLLSVLLLNHEKSFYMRELEKETGASFLSVYRELLNLKKMNLVEDERKGKLRFFRINKKSPIYDDIRKMIMKTEGIGNIIAHALKNTGSVMYALVFGSVARGEDRETSDIDLLLVGKIDEERLISNIKKAENETKREINYVLWPEKEFRKRVIEKDALLMEISKNPVIMIIGDENGFRKAVK